MSEENKKKLSERNKGRKASEETKQKLSEANKGNKNPNFGKKASLETRKKQSIAGKGRIFTEEHRKHLSESGKKRIYKKKTQESIDKWKKSVIGMYDGEKNPMAKLTEENVREIRKMIDAGIKVSEIAKKFNVTTSNIYCIKIGKTWKNII
jgi:hypothetical protein